MEKIKERIEYLREEIRINDRFYYAEDFPLISDAEYDSLVNELIDLEERYPQFRTDDSPTQRLGDSVPSSARKVVKHTVPMLSMGNVYNYDALEKFVSGVEKKLGQCGCWAIEPKIDGIAIELVYEKGVLKRALTRGNGIEGQDVTVNARAVRNIPLKLINDFPEYLEVRGEVFITSQDFSIVNQEAKEEAEREGKVFKPFANARNLAAGTLKQSDPSVCQKRRLRFLAHSEGVIAQGVNSHLTFMNNLRRYGVPTVPHNISVYTPDVYSLIKHLNNSVKYDYEVDGLVVKLFLYKERERIGANQKNNKWQIALKTRQYEEISTVKDIVVSVGKTGNIIPVAILDPVSIDGSIVSRVTLHNASFIEKTGVKIGSVVVIEKAGKVVPKLKRVTSVVKDDAGSLKEFKFPSNCPCCNSPLVRKNKNQKVLELEPFWRCENADCPAKKGED